MKRLIFLSILLFGVTMVGAQDRGQVVVDSIYEHGVKTYSGSSLVKYFIDSLTIYRRRYYKELTDKTEDFRNAIKQADNDSLSFTLLDILTGAHAIALEYSKAIESSDESLAFAQKSGDPHLISRAYITRGNIYNSFSRYDSAMVCADLAMPFADKSFAINPADKTSVYMFEGSAYLNLGYIKLGINSYMNALKLGEQLPDFTLELTGLKTNIATAYKIVEDYTAAVPIYKNIIANMPENYPVDYRIYPIGNLAQCYLEMGELDSARFYLAKYLDESDKDAETLNNFYTTRSAISEMDGDYLSAKSDALLGVRYAREIDNPHTLGTSLGMLAMVERKLGNYSVAERLNEEAEVELKQSNANDQIKDLREEQIRNALQQISSQKIAYFNEYIELADSIESVEVKRAMSEMQIQYKTRIRQDSIANLTVRSEVAETLADSRTRQLVLASLFSLISLLGLLYIRLLNRRLGKRNEEVILTKQQVDQRNDQIQTLNQDLNHRTSNYLGSIRFLLERQRDSADEAGLDVTVVNSLDRQILAFTKVQDKLKETLDDVNLKEYLEDFCEAVREALAAQGRPVQFNVNVADVDVKPSFAAPLALIINELATNSMKYARREDGLLRIALDAVEVNGGELRVFYRDGGAQDGEIDQRVFSSGQGVETILGFTDQLKGRVVRYGEESYDYEAVFGLEG